MTTMGVLLGVLLGYSVGSLVVIVAAAQDEGTGFGVWWKDFLAVAFIALVWPLFVYDVLKDWEP